MTAADSFDVRRVETLLQIKPCETVWLEITG